MRGKILLGACLAAAMALAVAAISPTVEPARAGPAGQGAAGSPAEGRPTPILTITPQQARTLFGGKAAKMILHYGPGRDPFPDGRSSPVFLLDFNRPQLEFEFVCDDARSGDGDPVISPDGTRVAYNDHGKIYVRRLAKDGPEKTYIADGFEQRWWFHPKTGNQYVIYADRRSSLGDNVQGTTSMRKLKTGTCEPAEEAKVLLKDLALNGGRSPDGRYICSTLPGCLIVELTDPLAVENATAKVLWSTGRMCNGTISQDPKRSGIFLYEDPGHNRLICCPGANHINDIPPPAGWRQMEWAEWSTHPDYLSASPSKEDDWENPDKHSGWIYQFSTGQWTQVADHVRDTHLWVAQGKKGYSDSSNISAGLTTKFYGGFAKRLDQGGPVKPILEELNRIAAGAKEPDKAAEAKAILDHVDEWAKGELERAKGLETSNPAGAEKAYKSLVVRFNGLEPAKAAQERLQDKQFQEDLKSWAFVEQMQAAEKRLKDVPGAQCSAKDVKFARINAVNLGQIKTAAQALGQQGASAWIIAEANALLDRLGIEGENMKKVNLGANRGLGLAAIVRLAASVAHAELTPTGLRCEYRRDPLGIDETKPRLSWQLESSDPAARSQRQTAYQILVASSRQALDKHQGDLWDSGKVVTNQAVRIEYAGKPLTSRQECHWNVRAWDQDGKVSAWSAPALWTMGLLRPEDWTAKWILDDESPPDREPVAPLFRKTFDLPSAPVRATVYVSSLGYHELYLNGQKVGSAVLAPQVSLMDRYVFYTTHDVSRLVREGRNGIGLWLGDGFVSRFFPHSRPQGIVQLEIECRDGSRVTVTTDETWKTHPSHIRRFGVYDYDNYGGERFDCGRELPDWNQPTLNDADWKPVRARTTGTPTLREAVEMDVPDRLTVRTPAGTPVLRAQSVPPNVVLQELSPKEITTESNQSCTVDLGQMVTGWFAFSGQGKPGQAVTLSYLQALKDGIVSKDVIIPDSEGRARSCNKFNYHTFRYVRVEGLAKAPQAGQIKALRIGPGLSPTFSFTCSGDLANRIHQASMNTLLANSIGGYISDCPERERAAYAGYCLAYAPFLMQHFAEGIVFLEKTIRDAVDAQRQDGLSATCSPVGPGGPAGKWTHQAGGGPVFAQAPWQIYLYTGDTRAMAMARAAAEKYLAALPRYFNDKAALVGVGQWDYLADWYAVIDGEGFNPLGKVIQANSMYILALERLSKSLEVLGEREAAARYGALADERRRLFHAHYYKTADANYGLDHMTYLAEPLLAEVPPEDEAEAVFRALEHNIRVVAKGHPTSGDGGTHNLLQCLLARQRPDLVYLMVNQTEPPSWGAMVKNGDASIWEHWFMSRAGHHSRCHVGVGSIGEWFLNGLAGIQCDPARPGFQHAIVRPYFPPDMDFLSASSDSVQGRIAVSWRKRDGAVTLEVSIPPNTTATLVLPVGVPESITESGRLVAQAPGIEASVTRDGLTFLELGSGKYVFAWTRGACE